MTPNLSFLYDGVPFDQLEKQEEEIHGGIRYTLPDGLQLECRVRRFPQQRVIWWTNYWHNPTDHQSGLITQLWDCDVTLPMAPDPPRVRRDRQSTWEPATAQLYVTNGANVKDDDNLAVPIRLWEGDSYAAKCEMGRSGMGTAPFFDFNRKEAGVLLAVGWTASGMRRSTGAMIPFGCAAALSTRRSGFVPGNGSVPARRLS